MSGGHSTDEEKGLISTVKVADDVDHDPEKDPELKVNGGEYESKKAILQVTWRFPVNPHPLNILALIYGYLPFIIPLIFFIDVAVERHFLPFYGLCVSGVVTVINELILKPIVKDPRPNGSANRKYNETTKKWEMKEGMPSGHVLNATTTMVWCLLEVAMRGPGFDEHLFISTNVLIIILVVMAPVPWARIYNQDHSLAQCCVAGILGICAGVAAYYIRAAYFPLSDAPYCVKKACLYGGKPWDSFVEGNVEKTVAAATTAAASLPSTTEIAAKLASITSTTASSEESTTDKEEEEEESESTKD
eukprot:TRINITY_DN48052_c0_g1_i1.p1 TRINITY_DN48052_c0_g1~~TRINITY_DN48052_c0_g1_i1.p1  ORF type:complete len:304 (+),score=56.55 TRINITY_DN48052_c0_g1_i1:68-979(+)